MWQKSQIWLNKWESQSFSENWGEWSNHIGRWGVFCCVYLLQHPCQVYLAGADRWCDSGLESLSLRCVWQRGSDWHRTCASHTQGDRQRPHSQSGRSLSVCHTAAWQLLPLRQNTQRTPTPSPTHPGMPIQANQLGDQLGANWQSPTINITLVAWLQKRHNGCGT